jgi:type VI secretion system secreted protein VgrG
MLLGLIWLGNAPAVRAESPVSTIERLEKSSFPRLHDQYKVLGSGTKRYNCIAWSLGITDRWIWPGERVEDFDQLYGQNGFRRLKRMDYSLQQGTDKIVLYAMVNKQGRKQCTHAARQMKDGSWTNKLGSLPLIQVPSPEHLAGPGYGRPVAVYVRVHAQRTNSTNTNTAGAN